MNTLNSVRIVARPKYGSASAYSTTEQTTRKSASGSTGSTSVDNKVFYNGFTTPEVILALKNRPQLEDIVNKHFSLGGEAETVEEVIVRILNKTWERETLLPKDWEDRINYHALFGVLLRNTTSARLSSSTDCPLLVAKCGATVSSLSEHLANIARQQHKNLQQHAGSATTDAGSGSTTTKEAPDEEKLRQFGEQMVQLNQTIKSGKPREMAAAVGIDMNKMHHNKGWFHSDWNEGVLRKLGESSIPGNLHRMIKAVICSKSEPVIDERLQAAGYVPPEGSPPDNPMNQTLWKVYTNDMLEVTQSKSTYFGDDLVFSRTGKNIREMDKVLDDDLNKLSRYCRQKKFDMYSPQRLYYVLV